MDNYLKDVFSRELEESEIIDESLDLAYKSILSGSERRRKKLIRGRILGISKAVIAACLTLMIGSLGLIMVNPSLAAEIPIVSSILKLISTNTRLSGDYENNSVFLTEGNISSYDGLSMELTEMSIDNNYIYLGVKLVNEDGFKDRDKWMTYAYNGMNYIYIEGDASIEKEDGTVIKLSDKLNCETPLSSLLEGRFEDNNTFIGIMEVKLDDTLEYSGETKISLSFSKLWTDLENNEDLIYKGNWSFELNASNISSPRKIELNQVNDDGIGIASISISEFEVSAELIAPSGKELDYVISIWGADGEPLESRGSDVERYNIYERDISTITIYVIDYYDYMDRCKGENYTLQPQYAVFTTTVSTE